MDDEKLLQARFLYLIGKIPNWEVYLTSKQLECCKQYIYTLNTYTVDENLNLKRGTCKNRLFGTSTSQGVIGKLEKVYEKLNNMGYFKKPIINDNNIKNNIIMDRVKDLFKIITELENYNNYLNKYQNDILYFFIKTRSLKQCSEHFNLSNKVLCNLLLGSVDTSIYEILKKNYDNKFINNWDNI